MNDSWEKHYKLYAQPKNIYLTYVQTKPKTHQNAGFSILPTFMQNCKKSLTICFLFLIPGLTFGQLYSTYNDYTGNIDKIVAKGYGRGIEINNFFGKYRYWYIPGIYSGWKDIYIFDSTGNIAIEKHYIKGKLSEIKYQNPDNSKNKIIENIPSYINVQGDYDEYEFQFDSLGRISKVKYWKFTWNSVKRLEKVDEYTKYEENRLVSFTRYSMNMTNFKMDYKDYTIYNLKYDTLGRRYSYERWESIPNDPIAVNDSIQRKTKRNVGSRLLLSSRVTYTYDSLGFITKLKFEYFDCSINNTLKHSYSFYYKNDEQGNWVKWYSQMDNGKKGLDMKRKIWYK